MSTRDSANTSPHDDRDPPAHQQQWRPLKEQLLSQLKHSWQSYLFQLCDVRHVDFGAHLDLRHGSDEWLEVRRRHITASMVASALGISRRTSRVAAMRKQKFNIQAEVSEDSRAIMDRGSREECVIRRVLQAVLGDAFRVTWEVGFFTHSKQFGRPKHLSPDVPSSKQRGLSIFGATPDGLVVNADGGGFGGCALLELKRKSSFSPADSEFPPTEHLLQLLVQVICASPIDGEGYLVPVPVIYFAVVPDRGYRLWAFTLRGRSELWNYVHSGELASDLAVYYNFLVDPMERDWTSFPQRMNKKAEVEARITGYLQDRSNVVLLASYNGFVYSMANGEFEGGDAWIYI